MMFDMFIYSLQMHKDVSDVRACLHLWRLTLINNLDVDWWPDVTCKLLATYA